MFFHYAKPGFLASLLVLVIVNACTNQPNYAPVMTDNKELTEEQSLNKSAPGPGKANQDIPKGNKTVAEDTAKFHLVKTGETLYSIGLSSGYGYQRLALWNHISPPYKVMAGDKIKFLNPDIAGEYRDEKQQREDAEKVSTRPKKAVNSPADKKKLENRRQYKNPKINLAAIKNTNKQQKSIVSIDNKKKSELHFAWPVEGRVLKSFSPAYNKGIDIAGKLGQSVSATEAGEVVYCGQGLIGFGQLLIIKHNKAYLSAYANNRRLLVKEGQQVKKGQVIAEVGKVSTKRTSLHFEIRKNGNPVNPLKLLPKR